MPAALLRVSRLAPVRARRIARSPLTLSGPLLLLARSLWVALALLGVVFWVLVIPVYHQHALSLHTTDCCLVRHPAEWRIGLRQLGLLPSFYAAYRVAAECLLAWPMFLLGVLIFLRKSDEWIALFVSITLLGLGMTATNDAAFTHGYPQWLAALLGAYGNVPYFASFLISYVFPDGRFVPRWTAAMVAVFVLAAAGDLFFPGSILDSNTWPAPVNGALAIAVLGTTLVAPIYRYRRVSDAAQREQTKWAVFGLLVAMTTFLTAGAIPAIASSVVSTPARAVLYDMVSGALVAGAIATCSLAFAIAILRYRLWDIDLIINRTLVYGALSVGIVGLYVLLVGGLGELLQTRGSFLLSLLTTGIVAALVQPAREGLQRGVNRLMYGRRDEPYAVISRLGRQLEATLAPDAVLPVIVETVARALRLPYVAIALKQDDAFPVAAAVGTAAGDPLVLPLLYRGEMVGRLILGKRSGEAAFSPADRRLLDDLARQAGVAAYAVRLTTDLQRSRLRLVRAREEERRRLRRDLHDGLGPALAAMAMQSEAARDLLTSDPAQTDALLADLTEQLQAATADTRRLVHELRPPALDDLGLLGAIRNQMGRFERGGLCITLDAPDSLPVLPAAVEVAAYRIVLEALNNVVRHAAARTCCIRLALDESAGLLRVDVVDDGRGIPDGRQAGVGLASMRERAAELGGICAIEPRDAGGTHVHAVLPVRLDGDGLAGSSAAVL